MTGYDGLYVAVIGDFATGNMKQDILNSNDVDVLAWPAHSPGMNPIDHLWDHFYIQIQRRAVAPGNRQDLERCLIENCEETSSNVIRRMML